jgi:cysteinyl-tRNA synthetase
LDLRYFFFTGQYRSFLDFTRESLDAAKTTRNNLIKKIHAYIGERIVSYYDIPKEDISDILFNQLVMPLLDDLDTPNFLARLQKAAGNLNDEVVKVLLYIDKTVLKI